MTDVEELTITDCLGLVRQFHNQIKAPVCAGPPQLLLSDPGQALTYSKRLLSLSTEMAGSGYRDQLLSRAAMALEELSEWLVAHAEGKLVGAADALADRFYVLLGDAVATGFPLGPLFVEVHRSNLTKLSQVQTGHGKGAKGPGYVRPDIASVLREYARTSTR